MTDRKIKKAALCITMSLVLVLSGCAAAAPATGQGSTGKEAAGQESTTQANAGQESTMQANAGQEAAGESAGQEAATQETPGQETVGEEMSAQVNVEEDEFDFEEGDPNTPAADGERPHCGGGDQHSRQRAGAGRRLYSRDFQSVGEAPVVFCLHCAE